MTMSRVRSLLVRLLALGVSFALALLLAELLVAWLAPRAVLLVDRGLYLDDPPRGYDTQGAQIWGHLVEPITIDPAVIVGDGECDLTNDNIQCSPRLVR